MSRALSLVCVTSHTPAINPMFDPVLDLNSQFFPCSISACLKLNALNSITCLQIVEYHIFACLAKLNVKLVRGVTN